MDSETPEDNSKKKTNQNQRMTRSNRLHVEKNTENVGKKQRKRLNSQSEQQLEKEICQNIQRVYNSIIIETEKKIKIADSKISKINNELKTKPIENIVKLLLKKKKNLEKQKVKFLKEIDSIRNKIKREQLRQDNQTESESEQSVQLGEKMIQENDINKNIKNPYQKEGHITKNNNVVLKQTIKLSILYYDREIYTDSETYRNILGQYSNYVVQNSKIMDENEMQYRCSLKLQFLKIYRTYLQDNDDFSNLQLAWEVIRNYFFKLLEQIQINFSVFKLPIPGAEEIYRSFLIRCLFNRTIQNLKSTVQKNHTLEHLLQASEQRSDKYLLYILTARQSFTYYDPQLKANLKEMIKLLKNSWYFRTILVRFLKGRQGKLNKIRKLDDKYEIQITEKLVKDLLSKLKIFFVDYPDENQCGKTDISDPNKQFPIFINSFSQYSKFGYNVNTLCSYFMCVIVHEIQNSLIRKIQLMQQEQKIALRKQIQEKNICRKYNQLRDEIQDGGWLLERFVFGGIVQYFSQNDYPCIKPLLKYEQNPFKDQQWSCIGNQQKFQKFLQQNQNHDRKQKKMTRKNNQIENKTHKKTIRTRKEILEIRNIDQQINKLQKKLTQMSGCSTPKIEEENVDLDSFEPKITDKYFRKFGFLTQQLHKGSKRSISQQLSTIKKKKSKTSQQIENDQKTQIKKMIQIIQKFGERESQKIFKIGQNYMNRKRSLSQSDSQRISLRKPCKITDWKKP